MAPGRRPIVSSKTQLGRIERLERAAEEAGSPSPDERDLHSTKPSTDNGGTAENDAAHSEKRDAKACSDAKLHEDAASRNTAPGDLYSRLDADFLLLGESRHEYGKLLQALRQQYHPIGKAEDLEVERIAVCKWRLKRAWRYENSINSLSRLAADDNSNRPEGTLEAMNKKHEALIEELKKAGDQIEKTGGIPQELKDKFFAAGPQYKELWKEFERMASKILKELKSTVPVIAAIKDPQELAKITARTTVTRAILVLTDLGQSGIQELSEMKNNQYLIPDDASLKRLITYETNAERCLARALHRLSQLQRRSGRRPILARIRVPFTQ
jgi:hypothetical protein